MYRSYLYIENDRDEAHFTTHTYTDTHTQSNHITQKRQNIKLKKTKQQKISYPCVTARTQKKKQTQTKSYPICLRQKQTNKNNPQTNNYPFFNLVRVVRKLKSKNQIKRTKQS